MAAGGGLAHGKHGTHGRIFDRRDRRGRRAVGGGRSVRPVPNPRAGKPVPRGMGFPAHVGATADRRSRIAAHAIWQRAEGGGRDLAEDEGRAAQDAEKQKR